MQMVSPPPLNSPNPTCTPNHARTHGLSHPRSPRRISFEVAPVPQTSITSPAPRTTSLVVANTMLAPNPRFGVVDLTESPVSSPYSSNPLLTFSRGSSTSAISLAVPTANASRPKSPTYPTRPLLESQSTPDFPASAPHLAPAPLAPQSRVSSPRRRPTFILPSDGESDRDRDQGETHDDSDDSDRTSFFSTEEFVVPASVLRDAVNAGGRVLDAQVIQGPNAHTPGWQSLEPESKQVQDEVQELRSVNPGNEDQGAAHGLRRWHALMEIVHTEVGYVRDLRTLANVYLALLPTLPLSMPTHQAVQELSREACELLGLHERFLLALEGASAQAAGGASSVGGVDDAVKQVAGLFIHEAPTFDLYQRFCATQPDTLRLLRPVQACAEWAIFEQRCAAGGDEISESDRSARSKQNRIVKGSQTTQNDLSPVIPTSSTVAPVRSQTRRALPSRTLSLMPSAFKAYASASPASQTTSLPPKQRRHSYESLVAVFGASGSGNMRQKQGVAATSTEHSASSSIRSSNPNSKLRFHDFLIKPVQRICKYPLMLEALRSKIHGETADVAVAMAVESMRAVAKRVDEARRKKEAAARSELIVERIESHAVATTEFVKSLGDCLLAGSLDVVHHHHVLHPVTTPVRVRYLGAFLYLGGYFLLVKVQKGKAYRIKHWFSLKSFELVDIPQDTALVPCSFRLSYMDHHFEMAAACQREKHLWMRAINEARSNSPAWTFEPVSSIQTVQANSEFTLAENSNMQEVGEPPAVLTRGSSSSSLADQSNPLAVLRLSTTRSRLSVSNPTVRIFSLTDDSSILLRRSSATNRIFVDRGLADVLSDLVSNLRKQAQAREEILFPPPHFSDTSQTISITAKNKLMRRGSMLVARPRALFVSDIVDSEDDTARPSLSTVRRGHPPTSHTRMSLLPALSVLHTEPESFDNIGNVASCSELQVPGHGGSFNKSRTPSGVMSLPSSPILDTHQQPSQLRGSEVMGDLLQPNHRRARSLVGSVKELMRRATTKRPLTQQASDAKPTSRIPDESSSDTGESTEPASRSSSHRRRVSSAPASPPLSSATHVIFSDSNSLPQPTVLDEPVPPHISRPSSPTETASKPVDKKSDSNLSHSDRILNPRRSFKNFYNRISAVDPA